MATEHKVPGAEEIAVAAPDHLGFSPALLSQAFSLLDDAIHNEHIPGAVALVGRGDRYVEPYAIGWRTVIPSRTLLHPDTIFDMASVTKVVTATTAALQLLEQGVWRLDDPVKRFWPTYPHDITLRHLLTHTSGLPAWVDMTAEGDGRARYKAVLENMPLQYETGNRVVYSCIGYFVLTELIETVTQQPFDAYCRHHIFEPLSMQNSGFNPHPDVHDRCAATELRANKDAPIVGVVHDENARGRGGVAGNAGLFSTALDMARFCRMMLNGGRYNRRRILSPASVAVSTQDHTAHLNDSRGLGWVVKGNRSYSSAGDLFSPKAFGHTGFTGTSIWIDPVHDCYVVLLTNRVHPTRENNTHIRLRARFHNAVMAALDV